MLILLYKTLFTTAILSILLPTALAFQNRPYQRFFVNSGTIPQPVELYVPGAPMVEVELSSGRNTQKSQYTNQLVQTKNDDDQYINQLVQTKNDDDIFWSLFSNGFFLCGGICYIVGSSWDLSLSNSGVAPQSMFLYHSIWILGPLVYLLNSFIDVTWAITTLRNEQSRRCLKRFYMPAHGHAAEVGSEGDTGQDILFALERFSRHAASWEDDNLIEGAMACGRQANEYQERDNVLLRLRRHFGHRRDLSSATTFGAAAIFGLFGLLAVFALVGCQRQEMIGADEDNNQCKWPLSFLGDSQSLENLGDILFGGASVIDVILCDLSFDDNNPWWSVASAVLWMLDALLYLRGDFVTLYHKSLRDTGEQAETMSEMVMDVDVSPGTNLIAEQHGIEIS